MHQTSCVHFAKYRNAGVLGTWYSRMRQLDSNTPGALVRCAIREFHQRTYNATSTAQDRADELARCECLGKRMTHLEAATLIEGRRAAASLLRSRQPSNPPQSAVSPIISQSSMPSHVNALQLHLLSPRRSSRDRPPPRMDVRDTKRSSVGAPRVQHDNKRNDVKESA